VWRVGFISSAENFSVCRKMIVCNPNVWIVGVCAFDTGAHLFNAKITVDMNLEKDVFAKKATQENIVK